ncbi:ureidoglycolate lyase [Verticiella sediminum]|uniref:Ureidoglycolate lyase n=1 Tax=Verticiella sediminum TaxID=1247510 RepID=A0A556AQ80_9BURK|nr:ureidoglycolate lyase [Verticiella sediminum]TSH95069.1 ureidoglycolate lyase [Verticiella sediminum]
MIELLHPEPLTADAFLPFGEVIETEGRPFHYINQQQVQRYDDLAEVDVLAQDGRAGISLAHAQPYCLPLRVQVLERHPLSSQAFIPLAGARFVVVVAPVGERVEGHALRAFVTNGQQGVNYRRGVWHHVLLAVDQPATFVMIDRLGAGPNCDRIELAPAAQRLLAWREV